MTGIEEGGFEACLLVGFHSRAGTKGGLLSHTWVGMVVHEIRLQGKPAGEALLDAAIVGHFGVPVVLVTGADDVVREAKADLGADLATVEVKKALGPSACASLTPKAAQRLNPRGGREGRARAGEAQALEDQVSRHDRRRVPPSRDGGACARHGPRDARSAATIASCATSRTTYRARPRPVWRGLEEAMREDGTFLK